MFDSPAFDLDAYLTRIGFTGRPLDFAPGAPQPTMAVLSELVVARATAVARLEAGWASVVAGVATKARASAHRPAMVAVPGAAGRRVLWLDVLTAIGPAQLGTVAVGSVSSALQRKGQR